jgi:hypothetical protein
MVASGRGLGLGGGGHVEAGGEQGWYVWLEGGLTAVGFWVEFWVAFP